MISYKVQYKYYQYNSGPADNGIKDGYRDFPEKGNEEAFELYYKIKKSILGTLPKEEDTELSNNLMWSNGYFIEVTLRILSNEIMYSYSAKENKKPGSSPGLP